MIKVSIIVPVYNVAEYLGRCIESVLNQSFTEYELILIDDGSTDDGLKTCEEYARQDQRIRVIHQDNQGVSVARNRGIEEAKGEYITFIDADDWVADEYIEVLYRAIKEKNADIAVLNEKNVYTNEDAVPVYSNYRKVYSGAEMMHYTTLFWTGKSCYPHGKLVKKWITEKWMFPQGRVFAEDHACIYHWYWEAEKVVDLEDRLYFYFQRIDSACRSRIDISKFGLYETYREKLFFFRENKLFHLYNWTVGMYAKSLSEVYCFINTNDEKEIEKLFRYEVEFFERLIDKKNLNFRSLENIYWKSVEDTQDYLIFSGNPNQAEVFSRKIIWETVEELKTKTTFKISTIRGKKKLHHYLISCRKKIKKGIKDYPWAYNYLFPLRMGVYWRWHAIRCRLNY